VAVEGAAAERRRRADALSNLGGVLVVAAKQGARPRGGRVISDCHPSERGAENKQNL
jgi:hypothetical protein